MRTLIILLSLVCWSSAFNYSLPSANWFRAQEICATQGQRLVSIESLFKQNEVVSFMKRSGKLVPDSQFWIGASDLAGFGAYSWVDTGVEMDYANWAEDEPNASHNMDTCVEMLYQQSEAENFKWNDNNCKNLNYFVCETIPCQCPLE
ncbi:C-type lectin 37Db-like isoform X2 [Uranotaenia lowii]|uniref:C-type lectin 37Db-like isoform X2 n=1 Tax=Uranotaenia lowii TaxID=190385 RepID=UPI002479E063|nr:C-type lectin 37Db-like isoform X2 [Uranotaenia lowii]